MNKTQMMAALATLPDVELLQAGKIDDPLGANEFYSARTVVLLLAKERQKCAKKCRNIAADLAAEPTYSMIAEQCATAIEQPNALGEGRERGILREASSGEAATSTDGLGATARD